MYGNLNGIGILFGPGQYFWSPYCRRRLSVRHVNVSSEMVRGDMCTLFRRLGDIGACTIQTFTRVAWSIAFVVVHHIVFLVFVSSSVFCFSLLIFTMFVAVLKLITGILFDLFYFFK